MILGRGNLLILYILNRQNSEMGGGNFNGLCYSCRQPGHWFEELEEFKSEIENLRLRKDKAEAIQMDQIIALLERADAATSLEDREKKYLMTRTSLGNQPLEPLRSFYCPLRSG